MQQSLLKILEVTVCNIPPQGGRKHPEQQYIQLDTTNILFICGGTFVGLDKIVRKRIGRQAIGFNTDVVEQDDLRELGELLDRVTPDDLIEFGMIPEFVGRLPVACSLHPLDLDALCDILTKPRNALVKQYQKLFDMESAKLEFTPRAIEEIARKAIKRDTGARALRSVVEGFMLDCMFDLPDSKRKEFTVTAEVVRGEEDMMRPPRRRKESA